MHFKPARSKLCDVSFHQLFDRSLLKVDFLHPFFLLSPLSHRLSRITFVSLYFWSCLLYSFILGSIHSCGENTVFFFDNKRILFDCSLWFLWLYTVFDSEMSIRLFCWALASMQIERKAHRQMWWIRLETGKG